MSIEMALQLFGGGPNAPAFACKTEALTKDFVQNVPYSTKRLENKIAPTI